MVEVVTMRARQAGFSLIEVLVAITIIGFVALAVAPMFVMASRSNHAAARMGRCAALAMERMERLRIESLDALAPGGSLTSDEAGYTETAADGYVVRWRIADPGAPTGARRIDVRAIARDTAAGPDRQVTFTTLRVP